MVRRSGHGTRNRDFAVSAVIRDMKTWNREMQNDATAGLSEQECHRPHVYFAVFLFRVLVVYLTTVVCVCVK